MRLSKVYWFVISCMKDTRDESNRSKYATWYSAVHTIWIALVSCPDPTPRGEGLVTSSWFLRLYWLLSAKKFPTAYHIIEDTIWGCNTGNSWLLQHVDAAPFVAHKLVINFQLCIHEFFVMSSDPFFVGGVWALNCESPMYRRTGFNCENLIIANCEFFLSSQTFDSQTYSINSPPLCAFCADVIIKFAM